VTFGFYSFRFVFEAKDAIHFAPGKPGNILRGAFGSVFRKIACSPECPGMAGRNVRECAMRETCAYARIFEPAAIGTGPSGLADWPRPFVFRAAHLDGVTAEPGQRFWFDVNVFEMRHPALEHFVRAFAALAQEGLGPRRGRAELVSAPEQGAPISISLDAMPEETRRLRVEFVTPTELKSGDHVVSRPEFGVLFARARDRVSTLRALYGDGPLDIDFRAMGERASAVHMTRCELQQVSAERRSSRTGQVHGLGGFVGVAEYEGDLREFVPYLDAARWTGVGRHCVWGQGEIRVLQL
jgi:CRISPR/Cas system endoribonuclease Cas6 (RAMP superfamily)